MVERLVPDGAIILAGGPSSRMGEAKALVEVAGKPMLQLVMEALGQSGIDKAILSMKSEGQASDILGKLPCEKTTAELLKVGADGIPFQIIVDEAVNQEENSAVRGMSGAVSLARNQGWGSIQMVRFAVPRSKITCTTLQQVDGRAELCRRPFCHWFGTAAVLCQDRIPRRSPRRHGSCRPPSHCQDGGCRSRTR